MKKIIWKLMVLCGTAMIMGAVCICVINIKQSNEAFRQSKAVLSELKQVIPEPQPATETDSENVIDSYNKPMVNPADDLFLPYEKKTEKEKDKPDAESPPPIEIDGRYYCGYLKLPALGIELPVMDSWSYPNLQTSPCRYSGSAESDDIVIAAHNYNSHFGRIKELSIGDEIIYINSDGLYYRYKVCNMEYIDGYDIDRMFDGNENEWDLTLFTCTLSGQSRVTIRADRIRVS